MSFEENKKINEYKIVLIGETGVGKTHLLSRFLYNSFSPSQISTISATYATKTIKTNKNNEITLQLWDTAGQETYRGLTKLFYQGAAGIIIVYDITKRDSFNEIKNYWYHQIKENAPKKVKLAIVGNKSDLYINEQVNEEEAKAYAEKIGAIFQLTSAVNSSGVDTLFDILANEIDDPDYYLANNDTSVRLSKKKKKQKGKKKKICCEK